MATIMTEVLSHLPSLSTGNDHKEHSVPSSPSTQEPVETLSLKRNATERSQTSSSLPDAIITAILKAADPETFGSLTLLDPQWYRTSQRKYLLLEKLHELGVSPDQIASADVQRLRQTFAQEARHRLFPAYRPKTRTFNFLASSELSPTAAPHGQNLGLAFSPHGTYMVAYSSTRIFVIDVAGARPYVKRRLKRRLAVQTRPRAVCISKDGRILAILSPEGRVNIYNLGHLSECHRISSIQLAAPLPRAIAITSEGSVVAAARDGHVEIIPTTERSQSMPSRRVACEAADHVAFSDNGLVLLITSRSSLNSSTTLVQAPLPDIGIVDGAPTEESLDRLWTSQPLFPTTVGDSSHASLLSTEPLKVVAYDALASAFGILDVQDLKFTQSSFSPRNAHLSTSLAPSCTLPSVSSNGDSIAIAFDNLGVLVGALEGEYTAPSNRGMLEQVRLQWLPQLRQLQTLHWVSSSSTSETKIQSRLIAVLPAPNAADVDVPEQGTVEIGRILVLDFDLHPLIQTQDETVVDLSEGMTETLDETDPIGEVRRSATQTAHRPINPPIARSVTSGRKARKLPQLATLSTQDVDTSRRSSEFGPVANGSVDLEEPYTPAEPRSRETLQRAASAVAMNRTPRHATDSSQEQNRPRVPHESDADNWVPPPPVYAKEPDSTLPEDFRQALLESGTSNTQDHEDTLGSSQPEIFAPTILPEQLEDPRRQTDPEDDAETQAVVPIEQSTQAEQSAQAPQTPSERKDEDEAPQLRPPRVRGAVVGARKSLVLQGSTMRRFFSDTFSANSTRTKSDAKVDASPERSYTPREAIPSPRDSLNNPKRDRPVSMADSKPRRHTLLARPVSMSWASLGNDGGPATGEGLPPVPAVRADTFDSHVTPAASPVHQTDIPSLPRPDLVESLHRRQTSGSIYSFQSDAGAPRAAIGAHRNYSAGGSPWASSLMLAAYADGGSPGQPESGDITPPRTAPPMDRRQRTQSGVRTNSNLAQMETPGRSSNSEQQQKKEQGNRRESSRNRLTTIKSVASLMSATRSYSASEKGKGQLGSVSERGGGSSQRQNGTNGVSSTIAEKLPTRLGGAKRRNTLRRRSSVRASSGKDLDYRDGDPDRKSKGGGKCNVM
ncbi:MAG: hypothetical protein M1828_007146 [Chrysothrix sp. TS-e1954]|nr:MAG: hypothetical protein M1828_007146 [Chrysothrix sp. TS-e1954]